jgi:hypothetical protein
MTCEQWCVSVLELLAYAVGFDATTHRNSCQIFIRRDSRAPRVLGLTANEAILILRHLRNGRHRVNWLTLKTAKAQVSCSRYGELNA